MTHFVQTQVKCWLAQWDLSGDLNACAIEYGAELVDDTMFGDTTRTRMGGLKTVAMSLAGHSNFALESGQAEELDQILFEGIAVADKPVTVAPTTGAEGERAFSFLAELAKYRFGGDIGAAYAFTVEAEATGALIRGTMMHNAARTSSASGTARQLGAVGASQKLYAALHVFAKQGVAPTLDVIVASDNAEGFPSPTTRITFAQQTDLAAVWATPVNGAIADDWHRISWTIGGSSTPGFTFGVVVGIQ